MFKSVSRLLSSSLLSQALPFLALPVITSMYSAEDFGVYSNLVSIASVLLVISMGRYEQSIIQIKKISDNNNMVFLCLFMLCVFSLLTFIVFIFWGNKEYLYIPVLVLLYGLYFLSEKKANHHEDFDTMSFQKIIRSLFEQISSIIIGYFFSLEFGMIYGLIIGLLVAVIFAVPRLAISLRNIKDVNISILKKYRNFPIYNMPHATLNSFVSYLPIIFIPLYFDHEILGYYALGMKLLQTPLFLFAAAIQNVISPRMATDFDNASHDSGYLKKIFFVQLICISFIIVVLLCSEKLFVYIFGTEWSLSYQYMLYMAPWVLSTFLVVPYSCITNIYSKQKQALKLEILYSILKASAFFCGVYFFTVDITLLLLSLTSTVCMLVTLLWFRKLINEKTSNE